MPDKPANYGKWSKEELRKAEATASEFLEQNSVQIADSIRTKAKFLETLVTRIGLQKTSFEDRLEYLARISEIADLIREDADGFFDLASQPTVARILATVPHP